MEQKEQKERREKYVVPSERYRLANRMILAGRIMGFGATGFFLTFLIGETAMEFEVEGMAAISAEVIIMSVLGGMALAGCILSWCRLRLGGILLIVSAVLGGVGIPPLNPLIPHDVRVWLIIYLPCLVAGVLFLNSWRISRELR